MICENREESIARLEWREAKAAIRRQKKEINIYGATINRKTLLSLRKLRAKMWKKMVPMNVVFSETWWPHYECPSCHANIHNAKSTIQKPDYCRWCGQRLSWRHITGKL